MTLMTIAPTIGGHTHDPQYAAGRADAYDDTNTLTLDALRARGALYIEHAHLLRAIGYCDRVHEMRREQEAVRNAETELAWSDRQAARR